MKRLAFSPLAALLPILLGCTQSASDVPAVSQIVATVTVVRPEKKSIRRTIEQPAYVEALEETPLYAHIAGYVQKVHVDIGDRVKGPRLDGKGNQIEAGQILAEIHVPEMEEDLKEKKALVVQAKAEVDQATAAAEAAEAHVGTAKALVREAEAGRVRAIANCERWASEYKRIITLAESRVIDAQTRDETRNQLKAADAACEEVEAKVQSAQAAAKESEAKRNKAQADLAAAKAKVQVSQAVEGRAAATLTYSKVRAPYDGVIASRNIHTGHYLTGAGTKMLMVIARTDVVRVSVDVPEAEATYISDGVPVRVRCQAIKDQDFDGKVTRSSWTLDSKARTLRTEIHLPNPQAKLRPGMYAYATFVVDLAPTFTLPASTLITHSGDPACYVVENGKAILTLVKVGARDTQLAQVLKRRPAATQHGLSTVWQDFTGNEQVVATRPGSLTDGQGVKIGER